MKQQQAAGVLAGDVMERAREDRELIAQVKAIHQELTDLRASRPEDDKAAQQCCDDCCAALEAHELELHNEIRRRHGQPPLEVHYRRSLWDKWNDLPGEKVLREHPAEAESEQGAAPAAPEKALRFFGVHDRMR